MSNEFIEHIRERIEAGLVKEAAEECVESAHVAFSRDANFLRNIISLLAAELLRPQPRPRPTKGGRFYGQRRISYTEHDIETGAVFEVERHVSQEEFERLALDAAKRGTHESAGKAFNRSPEAIKTYKRKAKPKPTPKK